MVPALPGLAGSGQGLVVTYQTPPLGPSPRGLMDDLSARNNHEYLDTAQYRPRAQTAPLRRAARAVSGGAGQTARPGNQCCRALSTSPALWRYQPNSGAGRARPARYGRHRW
ncbi:hypothetical protein AFERRI_100117 [Acidithiobacillus ferrivorans]|uniref:Uncharacterized protein n=1 Tax=Acidithiobacillus ferrivorans TaxID=160808 RepID=A0A060UIY9_9PROT|nr:hypothetical protein AFERRI_100117 [Acidithiobacillus ferrivorans]